METPNNESDISPLIPDMYPKENNIKKIECYDFLQFGAFTLIILFTCFKP